MKYKINKDVKLIVLTTLIIVLVLILFPIAFLKLDFNKFKPFNINDSVIKKSTELELPKNKKVKLYRKSENKVYELDLEEYITSVVSGEVPANFDEEALKAQAVAARTYYVNKINKQKVIFMSWST